MSSTTGPATALDEPTSEHLAAAADAADTLGRTVSGTVRRPGDDGYDAALTGYNLALAHRPALVVHAATPVDVALTVRTAVAYGLGVGVRSTGHSAAPTGPADVLLDTSALDRLEIDVAARTATVGAGVRWRAVLDAAAPHGLGGLCGSSPDVGVVGYTLGGGLGPLARTFGLAADHVRSIDVVTPSGDLVTATPEHHADLFWALRGGGGAYGVVTALTFDLFPLTVVRAGALWFDVDDAPAVLHRWRGLTSDLPDDVSTSVVRLNLPPLPHLPEPLRGRAVLVVRYVRHGDLTAPDPLVDALRRTATPLMDTVGDLPYARLGEVHGDPEDPMPMVDAGCTLRELPAAAVDAFLAATPADSPVLMAELRLLGGAVARHPVVPSAVGGRDAEFTLFVGALAAPLGPPDVTERLQDVLGALAPWSTGGALLNLAGPRDAASARRVRTAYGAVTYDRLVALRRSLDPHGVLDPSARWDVVSERGA
ncbi:FAD/FMN-containing dehydrogenase [Isoptericola jiangsuensis]|uniref:FAD/FMN-containing dehydrogenase n=1 Tax=Isoptericola jiangsuensis TaxID=548579 RepID=A0A2A9EZ25_9MICO|nr:FAD-binding oxidoreductase [Isoptericola jiangsuensis]PFG43475.1 FAD/FMN-containing dehydrogenase [Isoptericola jiangsuensis]